uniref:Uncharacterized protein n=1 Tax=Ixodes ricinus TaxID=34613 RepID=A0A0K8RF22_IXORI
MAGIIRVPIIISSLACHDYDALCARFIFYQFIFFLRRVVWHSQELNFSPCVLLLNCGFRGSSALELLGAFGPCSFCLWHCQGLRIAVRLTLSNYLSGKKA